ncbi:1-acyl-sn-glycerol-3-phosphate acyltransferase [Chlamydia sp.]|uniref:lysophospholipid acyltransferase family protein n=1 Tax=Chlamydia sp. TaxID=35827 RepID=UPI0025BBBA80|nr:1-acyl-sn-glycerol-3-phosphate acyltransferase [Chlamydia sp.]MBQ8498578.1 1-acyl-sn-glycerol-3-phosphate acyltransferase [Chlamydia sp.]
MKIGFWRRLYEVVYTALIGCALKLRYRVSVEGLEVIGPNPHKGALFLSNHVAEIDPVILEHVFWLKFHVRPIAVDYLFNNSVVKWFLDSVRAIPVPSVVPGRDDKRLFERMEHFYVCATRALDNKESLLLYPSGRLSRNGREEIVNQHAAFTLLHRAKECDVFLVKITGLWGSSFSRYKTGSTPKLGKVFKDAIKALLWRGIFFMPKREVKVSVCQADYSVLKQFPTKQEFNTFLSDWFNQEGGETPLQVPYA